VLLPADEATAVRARADLVLDEMLLEYLARVLADRESGVTEVQRKIPADLVLANRDATSGSALRPPLIL